jgi:hypothetical protein
VTLVLGWFAAVLIYPVAAWLTRLGLTVVTLPLAEKFCAAPSLAALRVMRLVGGAGCGCGGFLAAAWILARFGQHAPLPLGAVLLVLITVTQGVGLRRLAGGPQFLEELFSLIGEGLGLLMTAVWWASA